MSREETLITTYGEMCDLIACMEIYAGRANQKKRPMTYDEAINLR
jgi:hypothetical protein